MIGKLLSRIKRLRRERQSGSLLSAQRCEKSTASTTTTTTTSTLATTAAAAAAAAAWVVDWASSLVGESIQSTVNEVVRVCTGVVMSMMQMAEGRRRRRRRRRRSRPRGRGRGRDRGRGVSSNGCATDHCPSESRCNRRSECVSASASMGSAAGAVVNCSHSIFYQASGACHDAITITITITITAAAVGCNA